MNDGTGEHCIKRHPDGSIDQGHYDRRARQLRGQCAVRLLEALRARLAGPRTAAVLMAPEPMQTR